MTGSAIGKDARGFGVLVVVSADNSPPAPGPHPEAVPAVLQVDLAALASTVRGQSGLPLTDAEAASLAGSLEGPGSDEEILANTLGMLRLVLDRLEPPQA